VFTIVLRGDVICGTADYAGDESLKYAAGAPTIFHPKMRDVRGFYPYIWWAQLAPSEK